MEKIYSKKIKRIRFIGWLVYIAWTLIIVASLFINIELERNHKNEILLRKAETLYDKDKAIRLWASKHGGVYVPKNQRTPSNKNLAHIPDRDIVKNGSDTLTLMNPAYIIRQMFDEYPPEDGIFGRIISNKVLNESNYPDDWEKKGLFAFDEGAKSFYGYSKIGDKEYFRFLKPLYIKESCLKCHAHQGYKVGDLRGGIGVSLITQPYEEMFSRLSWKISFYHSLILLVGFIGIYFGKKTIIGDLTDIRLLNERLKEKEKSLSIFLDSTLDGVWEWDIKDSIITINEKLANLLSQDFEKYKVVHLSDIEDLFHKRDFDELKLIAEDYISGERESFELECRIKTGKGNYEWVSVRGQIKEYSEENLPKTVMGTLSNINNSKISEIYLRENVERYRIVSDYTYNWEYWLSAEKELLYCSPACEKISGYSREEFTNNPNLLTEIVYKDDKLIWEAHTCKEEDEGIEEIKYRIVRKDGTVKWIAHICRLIIIDGQLLGFRATNRDIDLEVQAESKVQELLNDNEAKVKELEDLNRFLEKEQSAALLLMEKLTNENKERIKAEKILTESEKKYKDLSKLFMSMSDNLPDLLWAEDINNKFIFVNKAICQKLLKTKDITEPIKKDFSYFFKKIKEKEPHSSEYLTIGSDLFDKNKEILESKKSAIFEVSGNIEGKFIHLNVFKAPLINEEGVQIGFVGSASDVTREKEISAQLHYSQVKNAAIVQAIPDSILEFDKDNKLISFNSIDSAIKFKTDDIIGLSIEEILPIEINSIFLRNMKDCLSNRELIEFEFIQEQNGEFKFFEARMVNRDDFSVLAFVRDITSSKIAQRELLNSESRFRRILEDMPMIGVILDKDANIIFCNKYLCEFTGWKKGELIGSNWMEKFIPPSLKHKINVVFDESINSEYSIKRNINEILLKNGETRIVEWVNSSLEIENKNTQVASIGRDVTEEQIDLIFSQKIIKWFEKVNNSESFDEVLNITLENSLNITGMDAGAVFSIDEKNKSFKLEGNKNLSQRFIKEISDVSFESEEMKFLIGASKPVFRTFSKVKQENYLNEYEEGIKSVVFLPVVGGEVLESVIVLASKNYEHFNYYQKSIIEKLHTEINNIIISYYAKFKITESSKRYELLFNSMKDGFALNKMIYNEKNEAIDYRFLEINPAFEEQTGLKKENIVTKTVLQILPTLDKGLLKTYEEVVKTKIAKRFNVFTEELGRYFEVTAYSPDKDLFATIVKDVTEKRITEEHLNKLSRAVEQSQVSIIITNLDGDIEYANPKFCELTGYEIEELIGNNPKILKSGYHSEEFYNEMWETIKSGREWTGIFNNIKKDGSGFWESAIISPIINTDGDITHFVAVKEDITERIKTEDELRLYRESLEKLVELRTKELSESNEKLEVEVQKSKFAEEQALNSLKKQMELGEMKSKFISTASHEFKTPLTTMLSSVELLEFFINNNEFDKTSKHIDRIVRSIEFLNSLINDVLLLNKTETGNIKYEPEPLNLLAVSKEIFSDIKVSAEDKNELNLEYTADLNKKYLLDRKLTTLILSNLLSNAVKYSPDGGEIKLNISADDKYIFISVSDEGIGLNNEDIKHIFEQFYRGENNHSIPGTGLGLSIVKKAVELHDGVIEVDSKLGEGTIFRVKLPVKDYDEKSINS